MDQSTRARIGTSAGFGGVAAIAAGSVLAALAYRGTAGEPYSPLNHFVSELGEPGVSALAPVFNLGLVIGGAGFVVFMIMLAASTPGPLRYGYGVLGAVAGVAGLLVGVFPMNHPVQHRLAALTFFDLGWIAVGLASLDFVRRADPRFPRRLAVVGALTVAAFIAFLAALFSPAPPNHELLAVPQARPAVWDVPTLEWAVIAGIMTWTFLVALAWRRALRQVPYRAGPAEGPA